MFFLFALLGKIQVEQIFEIPWVVNQSPPQVNITGLTSGELQLGICWFDFNKSIVYGCWPVFFVGRILWRDYVISEKDEWWVSKKYAVLKWTINVWTLHHQIKKKTVPPTKIELFSSTFGKHEWHDYLWLSRCNKATKPSSIILHHLPQTKVRFPVISPGDPTRIWCPSISDGRSCIMQSRWCPVWKKNPADLLGFVNFVCDFLLLVGGGFEYLLIFPSI